MYAPVTFCHTPSDPLLSSDVTYFLNGFLRFRGRFLRFYIMPAGADDLRMSEHEHFVS